MKTVKHTIRKVTREYEVLQTIRDTKGRVRSYVIASTALNRTPFIVSAQRLHKENPQLIPSNENDNLG